MHRSRAHLASLLCAFLMFGAVAPAVAATRSEYQEHVKNAEEARQKAAQAQKTADALAKDVAALDKQVAEIEAQAQALEPKISAARKRTSLLQSQVNSLKAETDATKQQIEATEAEYAHQQELLAKRMTETYRQGQWFYFDLLLGSADIGDLIKRSDFVSRVIESNNQVAEDLDKTATELTRAKVKLERSLAAQQLKRREAAAVEAQLQGLQSERQRAAAAREAVQSQKATLVSENRANAKRLLALAQEEEAESAKIARELAAAGRGSGLYAGTMSWPVPASTRITSPFGWRYHPIFHTRRFHAGIDISGNGGAPPVMAAAGGRVIYAGYRGGYGNTIMVDAGNGVVTLYGHLSRIGVSYGQDVSEGSQIGNVGSTGNSTGPHLHFEVRVNGEARNPMGYL